MARFFKLSRDMADFLRDNLTHSEWKLWSFLVTLDPFGNHYIDLPDTLTILSQCKISKATFYRAIAKFQELKLFDFQDKGFSFRNLSGNKTSLMGETEILMDETKTITSETDGITGETLSIYKEFKNIQTLSESEGEKPEDKPDPELAVTEGAAKLTASVVANKIELEKEKFSAARTKNDTKGFRWLVDGPWCIDGKLDPNFRDWLAQKWLDQYGGDINSKRADVLTHFKKDPDNLPIRWEQYQGEYLKRVQNTQILLDNGVEIPPDYQDRLIANQRALTAELPPELNPLAVTAPALPVTRGYGEVGSTQTASVAAPLVNAPASVPAPTKENWQAYQLYKPIPKSEPATPEQIAEAKAKIQSFLKGFGSSRPSVTPSKALTEDPEMRTSEIEARNRRNLEELNRWIVDPVLRSEAMRRVMLSDCYKCLFDEKGTPYQVIYGEEF